MYFSFMGAHWGNDLRASEDEFQQPNRITGRFNFSNHLAIALFVILAVSNRQYVNNPL